MAKTVNSFLSKYMPTITSVKSREIGLTSLMGPCEKHSIKMY